MRLTDAGRLLSQHFRVLLSAAEAASADLASVTGEVRGTVGAGGRCQSRPSDTSACGPSGLFSEEYDVAQRQIRGNLPQAFVHALMLEASSRLAGRDAAALTHPRAVHSPTRGHTTTTTHRRQPVVAGREQDHDE